MIVDLVTGCQSMTGNNKTRGRGKLMKFASQAKGAWGGI